MRRQLRFWVVLSGVAALAGYVVAAATSESSPPFAASAVNYAGWFTFVMASLTFLVMVGAALAEKLVRTLGRHGPPPPPRHPPAERPSEVASIR